MFANHLVVFMGPENGKEGREGVFRMGRKGFREEVERRYCFRVEKWEKARS